MDHAALSATLRPHRLVPLSHVETRPFTECFVGAHLDSDKRVFIKVLHSDEPRIRQHFAREVSILQALTGRPGFPVLVAASSGTPCLFHACEYISVPSLEAMLKVPNDQSLLVILQHAAMLARWIACLHRNRYAHRDLSPDHLFVGNDRRFTVVDFGMAKCTRNIPAREAQLYDGYDIQAFGMILWELICGRSVFPYRSERLSAQISSEIELIRTVSLPPALVELITGCLCGRSEFTPAGLGSQDPLRTADDLVRAISSFERVQVLNVLNPRLRNRANRLDERQLFT